ncbi:MAG: hypothetical protein KTR30_35755 [Saprospiraceae bacterium]|nr:hypothetical protein [Saprospiraceae bacterium]
MNKLFARLLFITGLLVTIDLCFGQVFGFIRDQSPDGRYYKMKYTLDDAQEDIIIIGSSRGEINYVPYLFEEAFGLSCWNASRGGQGLPYFRAVEEGILQRHSPKLVVLNLEVDLLEHPPFYQEAGFLRVFYRDHPNIQSILNNISPNEKWKLQSNLYAFNSSFYYLLRPFVFHNLDGKISDQGWKPSYGSYEDPGFPFEVVDSRKPLNQASVQEFDTLVQHFIKQGVQLVFSITPNYGEKTIMTSSLQYIQAVADQNSIPLFNFSADDSFTKNATEYLDIQHLNVAGAKRFTNMLIDSIQQRLPKFEMQLQAKVTRPL